MAWAQLWSYFLHSFGVFLLMEGTSSSALFSHCRNQEFAKLYGEKSTRSSEKNYCSPCNFWKWRKVVYFYLCQLMIFALIRSQRFFWKNPLTYQKHKGETIVNIYEIKKSTKDIQEKSKENQSNYYTMLFCPDIKKNRLINVMEKIIAFTFAFSLNLVILQILKKGWKIRILESQLSR